MPDTQLKNNRHPSNRSWWHIASEHIPMGLLHQDSGILEDAFSLLGDWASSHFSNNQGLAQICKDISDVTHE